MASHDDPPAEKPRSRRLLRWILLVGGVLVCFAAGYIHSELYLPMGSGPPDCLQIHAAYNPALRRIAAQHGVGVVPVHEAFLGHGIH
jgi:hypothetical protein